MTRTSDPWILVLAARSGTRLTELTVGDDRIPVPNQFCSLRGGRSLLLDTVGRALRLTRRDRIVVVVAAEHERWWRPQLGCIARDNVLVQPANRGTVAGIVLPLAHVLARDPDANLAVLPSDHHVATPDVLLTTMRSALAAVQQQPQHLVLLGIDAEAPDTEYGWIVPDAATD